ncbi:MAG TPA: iron chelate uptake ABC transporter family permease subunit [Dehalococcoidia bacterium]
MWARRTLGDAAAEGGAGLSLPSPSGLWLRLGGTLALLLLVSGVGLSLGSADIPPGVVARILLSHVPGLPVEQTWPDGWDRIVWDIRLPRVLLAGLVGGTLAYAGAAYQGVFRNPLADPYLIGVAAGAGLGATIAFLLPLDFAFYALSPVPALAFAGGLLAVALSYGLARTGTVVPTATLVLAGVAVSSLATAGMSFLFMLAGDDLRTIFAWIMGGMNGAGWRQVGLLVPYSALAAAVVLVHGRVLNVLQLNEEEARQLGVNVERTKLLLIAAASLATAAAVSVSGLIGFVGLVVPHAVRLLWGPDYRRLVPLSMVAGAVFLITADLVARTAVSPAELPVGVVTAFSGAPFFLFLLRRRSRAGG